MMAFRDSRTTPSCEVEAVSEYLVTEPYGGVEQDEFLNGVLKLRTLLHPGRTSGPSSRTGGGRKQRTYHSLGTAYS